MGGGWLGHPHSSASSWAAGSRCSSWAGSSAARDGDQDAGHDRRARGGEQQRRKLPGEHGRRDQAEQRAGHRAGVPGQRALGDHQAVQRRLGPAERADRGQFRRPLGDADDQRRRRRPARPGRRSPRPRRSPRLRTWTVTTLPSRVPTTAPRKASVTATSRVSDMTPMARLSAPTSVRPGVRSTFTTARPVIRDGWRARRTASTGGRTEATGSARAASQAGTAPATSATATATGTASAARGRGRVQAQRRGQRRGQQRGQRTGDQPDQRDLAEHHGEQPWPGPAQRGQHPEFPAAGAHRGGRRVGDEQRADHEDQREQRHAAPVDRVQDRDRDALLHPVLAEQQRRASRIGHPAARRSWALGRIRRRCPRSGGCAARSSRRPP